MFGIVPADDVLHEVSDVPGWSENLQVVADDGARACYAHFSRMPEDPEIWEGIVVVYLPDGTLRASRTFGRSVGNAVASTGPLTLTPVVPLRRWRLQFDGMARVLSREQSAAGPLADGPVEALRLELDLECTSPPWGVGSAADAGAPAHALHGQSWARVHLEQAVRVHGAACVGGEWATFAGVGMRDHSIGPRDYGVIRREGWVNAVFPSGRAFCALLVEMDGRPSFSEGFVWTGEKLHSLVDIAVPPLADARGEPTEFSVTFGGADGTHEVQGRMRHSMALTLERPCRMPLGAFGTGAVMVEGPATYRWDGETGHGWVERIHYRDGS